METNGHFPLQNMRASKDWVGNWGWNVFTLMDQITSFLFWDRSKSSSKLCVSSIGAHYQSLKYWSMFRFCRTEMFQLCSHLAPQMGPWTHHFTTCPSTEMKRCGFPLSSILPLTLFPLLSHLPLLAGTEEASASTQLSEDWWNYITGHGK